MRGVCRMRQGRSAEAEGDLDALLSAGGGPGGLRLMALYHRACARADTGRTEAAMEDVDAFLGSPRAPLSTRADALLLRADLWGRAGDGARQRADLDTVVGMRDLPDEKSGEARDMSVPLTACAAPPEGEPEPILDRAFREDEGPPPWREWVRRKVGDGDYVRRWTAGDLADCDEVLAMEDLPDRRRAGALVVRACIRAITGDEEGAFRDADAVQGMEEEAMPDDRNRAFGVTAYLERAMSLAPCVVGKGRPSA